MRIDAAHSAWPRQAYLRRAYLREPNFVDRAFGKRALRGRIERTSRINGTIGGPSHLTIVSSALHASFGSCAALEQLSKPVIDDMSDDPAARVAFEAMLHEQTESDICTRALVGALMKECLLLFIRRRIGSDTCPLAITLRDERIARASSAIHANSGRTLRVRDLAARAGMSRSAFAKRFLEAVHVTPMEFAPGNHRR